MARTKQTARREVGGKAPRKSKARIATQAHLDSRGSENKGSGSTYKKILSGLSVKECLDLLKTFTEFKNQSDYAIKKKLGSNNKPATVAELRAYISSKEPNVEEKTNKSPIKLDKKEPIPKIESPKKKSKNISSSTDALFRKAVDVLGEDKVVELLQTEIDKIKNTNERMTIYLELEPTLTKYNEESNQSRERKYDGKLVYRAIDIITGSLTTIFNAKNIICVALNANNNFDVLIKGTKAELAEKFSQSYSQKHIEEEIKYNYGEGAYDTWMEGDIYIGEKNEELLLKLVNIRFE